MKTDNANDMLMMDKLSQATGMAMSQTSGFPKTTNQDFHSTEVFRKALDISNNRMDKSNFKKSNVYSAYVNAMFNSGVFSNPW